MFAAFGEFKPDVSDLRAGHSILLKNVLPRGDGYGPLKDLLALTSALAAACRGLFFARKSDGSVVIFAGTSTKLYRLNNTTYEWVDVSKSAGSYSAIASTDVWQFAQYGNYVFAVQANVAPQVYDLSSSTEFADLGGSPPQAKYISIVNRFVVLSGLTSNPYRIQWSGLNATTTWTSGTNSSDYQDFSDGGIVMGIAGGETGIVFQGGVIRRMTYAPGSPVIFQIERVTRDIGLYAPYSLITSNDRIYWLASQGFYEMDSASYPVPLGRERFDRTFFAEWDATAPQLMVGVSDPQAGRVFWAYKTATGTTGLFNKILCYDTVLKRATTIDMTGEYIASFSQPGVTLENLDSVSASIDALTQSLDSYGAAQTPEVVVVNSSHVVCTLRGSNLEATLETPEYAEQGEGRIYTNFIRPITDAPTVYASVLKRETQYSSSSATAESLINSIGVCPLRVSARYMRGKIRIPAATSWTFATGVETEGVADGER